MESAVTSHCGGAQQAFPFPCSYPLLLTFALSVLDFSYFTAEHHTGKMFVLTVKEVVNLERKAVLISILGRGLKIEV